MTTSTTVSPTIRVDKAGGPEEMKLVELPVGEPGPKEVRIRHHAIGLNFLDVYQRSGVYPLPLPLSLGNEAAGVIEAVGRRGHAPEGGRPRGLLRRAAGSYSLARVMAARHVVRLPDAISFETGAAMMLKGMTTQYLFKRTRPQEDLVPGDFIVFHAAAGGVGLIACQWARALGLKLIGTAGSDEKCALARDNGAAFTVNYRTEDFAARVKEITGGKGVKVVYDSIGKDTWEKSLDCLRPFGLMVCFGAASGAPAPMPVGLLAQKGSLHLTRPTLVTHTATLESVQAMAADLFSVVESGQVKIHIAQRYALADAAKAHRDLEARKTIGSSILIP